MLVKFYCISLENMDMISNRTMRTTSPTIMSVETNHTTDMSVSSDIVVLSPRVVLQNNNTNHTL